MGTCEWKRQVALLGDFIEPAGESLRQSSRIGEDDA